MHFVYIIHSTIDGSYYIGESSNVSQRLLLHNSKELNIGKSRLKMPWELFFVLETENRTVALKIEKHIKRMKSRKYIQDLKKYPEIGQKLLKKYS
ncbi:GIY-YIG nuclease family protein [Muriicola jejuensis]|uniref:GIY-YIG nuclease family protein n=1 Tax=Muriicola jejuensis TaxID=504488 RepID=A0A6P0U9K0_9FLAO|nr:GIY-YIG nuclease family protein [Muriicola jejuensis]NER09707.1 GIY-YIG nuclease family protein [Muriicola jejuensis]